MAAGTAATGLTAIRTAAVAPLAGGSAAAAPHPSVESLPLFSTSWRDSVLFDPSIPLDAFSPEEQCETRHGIYDAEVSGETMQLDSEEATSITDTPICI